MEEPVYLLHHNEKHVIENRSELMLNATLNKLNLAESFLLSDDDLIKFVNDSLRLFFTNQHSNREEDKIKVSKIEKLANNTGVVVKFPFKLSLNMGVLDHTQLDSFQLFRYCILLIGSFEKSYKNTDANSHFSVRIQNKSISSIKHFSPNIFTWNLRVIIIL